MKKGVILILLVIFPLILLSQPDNVKQILDKYNGKDGFTVLNLNSPSDLFGDDAKPSVKDEIKDVRDMIIMSYEPDEKPVSKLGKEFTEDLKNLDKKLGIKPMLSITNEDEFIRIYKQQNKDKQLFILISIEKDGEARLIWVNGNLDFNSIQNLGKPDKKKNKKK